MGTLGQMFYYVSKVAWAIFNPVSLYSLLVLAVCFLSFTSMRRLRNALAGTIIAVSAVLVVVPVGSLISWQIETRFPQIEELPDHVDGIIVLGGAIDPEATRSRNQYSVNNSFDRVITFAEVAQRYPAARLVYTGGSHAWNPEVGKADVVEPLLQRMGVRLDRLYLEAKSRNTHENAVFSFEAIKPAPDETWVLVTSGYHMPRAIGSFRHAGWPETIIAYPVDF